MTEQHKNKLAAHLRETVRAGISGRDNRDVIDILPSRAVFAGVLQAQAPPKVGESSPTHDTALGIDCRVVPDIHGVRLTISPKWSFYHAVFPTFQQTHDTNPAPTAVAQPAKEPAAPPASSPDELPPETEDDAPTDEAQDDTEAPPQVAPGKVVLPRAFKRLDLALPPIALDIPGPGTHDLSATLSDAIREAVSQLSADPRRWRHLGDPAAGERTLGDRSVLRSEADYLAALQSIAGAAVAPPAWALSLGVECQEDPAVRGALRIRMFLANRTMMGEGVDPGLLEPAVFDARLDVRIETGSLAPFEFLLAPKDYRGKPEMPALGINCSIFTSEDGRRIHTESLPVYEQPLMRTRDDLSVSFAELAADDPTPALRRVTDAMQEYLRQWDSFLSRDHGFSEAEGKACSKDREGFADECEQFALGIRALTHDARLMRAFRLANTVFGRLAEGSNVKAWRLFQIGFIVSQLPSLAVREVPADPGDAFNDQLNNAFKHVGVLWFPTGGGKTEAYLGLLAVALIYDRLRGKKRGVTAWMRFPLRMLSLQQLERLSRVIAALNVLRKDEPTLAEGDPFAVGYYVGDGVTPNSVTEDQMGRYQSRETEREVLRVLRKCPFCKCQLEIAADRERWRLLHRCTNNECFSNVEPCMKQYRGSLPLCITDNEIYRYLPSVLVGTVDKLAIIARAKYFTHILGGPAQSCAKHGYTSYDECIERWICGAKKKDLSTLEPSYDPAPALLIQDELHLLRSELGVFNGHYEGLLRFIASRRSTRPPKVLAATATIEAFDAHAFHLYLTSAKRFPAPSYETGESFYATTTPLAHRRSFVGILSHTRGIEELTTRLLALYWAEIRRLESDLDALRAAVGDASLTDDHCLDLLRLYDLSLVYVNKKATGGDIQTRLGAVNESLRHGGYPDIEGKLLTGDNPVEDVGATLDRIENESRATEAPRLNVLIATSLISHGVDLERINAMAMAGMPSRYAEYVQASSRCARSHPGTVFVCFKASDARESSQFTFFVQMHQHLDRLIEAVAVNRFASFAPRKTVPGLLAGLLLSETTPRLFGRDVTKTLDHLPTLQIALGFKPGAKTGTKTNCINQAELLAAIHAIIGVETTHPPATEAEVRNARRVIDEVFEQNIGTIGRSLEGNLKDALQPILSFRDVDEGIEFGSLDSSTYVSRLRPR